MSPAYGHVTKVFFESEFQQKGNKQKKKKKKKKKKTRILSKVLRFSWQEQIQKIKLFNYHIEKDIISTKFLLLGQEPTFKTI